MNIFAERLKKLRTDAGATQAETGLAINVTKAAIHDMESGRCKTTLANAALLADYFDVSLDYLVGRVDEPKLHARGNG